MPTRHHTSHCTGAPRDREGATVPLNTQDKAVRGCDLVLSTERKLGSESKMVESGQLGKETRDGPRGCGPGHAVRH